MMITNQLTFPGHILVGVTAGVISRKLADFFCDITQEVFPINQTERSWSTSRYVEQVTKSKSLRDREYAKMLRDAVIIGPIVEEFLLRRVLYDFLGDPTKNLIFNPLLFGIAHFQQQRGWRNIAVISECALAGIIFTSLRITTGSLITPIVAHSVANFIACRRNRKVVESIACIKELLESEKLSDLKKRKKRCVQKLRK